MYLVPDDGLAQAQYHKPDGVYAEKNKLKVKK